MGLNSICNFVISKISSYVCDRERGKVVIEIDKFLASKYRKLDFFPKQTRKWRSVLLKACST